MENKSTVYVIGSTNQDIVLTLERRPNIGETLFADDLKYFQGGKGANQALASHKMGAKTKFISALGADAFGKELKDSFDNANLDCDFYITKSSPTGTAIINVDYNGDNSILVVSGANNILTIDNINLNSKKNDILLIQNELNEQMPKKLLELAKSKKMVTILNNAPATPILELLDKIDYLIVNEHELEISLDISIDINLANIDKTIGQIEELSKKYKVNLIVTIGEKGVIGIIDNKTYFINGHKVNVVDTTGAGDCFCGTFASCISQNIDIKNSLEYANLAASISIQSLGASSSYPDKYTIIK